MKAFTSSGTSGLPAPERGTFKGVAEKVMVAHVWHRGTAVNG